MEINMNSITYNGKDYKVRTFHVKIPSCDNAEGIYAVTSEALIDEMRKVSGCDDDFEDGSIEQKIDEQIYHYVEEDVMDLCAEAIVEYELDIPMRIIDEITY